jgi:outer membrane protein assembly factor BamB
MPRRVWGAFVLLLVGSMLLGACRLVTTPTPAPTLAVTATPSATPVPGKTPLPTASPILPTPTPDGPLPSVVAELDLGLPLGEAYGPAALAVDDQGLAYVVSQRHGETGLACLAVVDLAGGQVRALWPLPGRATGPVAAGGGRVYVAYEGPDNKGHLLALQGATGEALQDLPLEAGPRPEQLWTAPALGRLYAVTAEGVQVRDAVTLQILALLPYPFQTTYRWVLGDPQGDRLYVALSNALYAYRASDLALQWQVEAPAQWLGGLVLDVSGALLVAQGLKEEKGQSKAEVLLYDAAQGQLLGRFTPPWGETRWALAWADAAARRIVYQERVYPAQRPPLVQVWSSDLEGYPTGERVSLGGGAVLQTLPRQAHLFALGATSHEVVWLEGARLAQRRSVALGVELHDLVVDRDQGRIYLNDTAGRLYEVDAAGAVRGKVAARRSVVAGSGELTLDPLGRRLLVAQAEGDGDRVSVVRLDTLQVTQVITGGNRVALDTRRSRALVGWQTGALPLPGEVQVWDLATGERVGAIPQAGVPAYNPLRDEIVVAGYSAHAYDAGSLRHLAALTPDIDAQSCPGCTGQATVVGALVYQPLNALLIQVTTTSAGKGPGVLPPPRVLSLDALTPLSHTFTVLSTCAGETIVWPARNGRVVESIVYSRYVQRANLVVRRAQTGELLTWRDGLALDLLTPDGKLALVTRDERWLALETEEWTPVGYTPRFCIHSYDPQSELMYALEGARLTILLPRWGQPAKGPAPQEAKERGPVRALQVSPGYGEDKTLFVVGERGVYRSRDGGQSWHQLHGGLPQVRYPADAHLTLALSPAFARDRTLFVGGWDGGSRGFGVWRSTDGGDTWQPVWRGLSHLCVEELVCSQDFARDGALLAYCRYDNLSAGEAGRSVFRSRDRGEHWEWVAQVPNQEQGLRALPQAAELLPQPPGPPVRSAKGARVLERIEATAGWRPALEFPLGEYWVAQATAPRYPDEPTLFVLTTVRCYRSLDGGKNWEVAKGLPAPGGKFTALATAEDAQGETLLLLGDEAGQVRALAEEALAWAKYP